MLACLLWLLVRDRETFTRDVLAVVDTIRVDCGIAPFDGMAVEYDSATGVAYDVFRDKKARRTSVDRSGCAVYYHDIKTGMNLTFITHFYSAFGTYPIGTTTCLGYLDCYDDCQPEWCQCAPGFQLAERGK